MDVTSARWLAVAAVVIAVALLGMGIIMAIAMSNMGGNMRGRSGSPQTPAIFDTAEVTIEIRDFDYFPRDATVEAGAEVTWVNRDSAPHTATDEDGTWDTGVLREDESGTLSFDQAGEFEYYCTLHPSMKATLTVR